MHKIREKMLVLPKKEEWVRIVKKTELEGKKLMMKRSKGNLMRNIWSICIHSLVSWKCHAMIDVRLSIIMMFWRHFPDTSFNPSSTRRNLKSKKSWEVTQIPVVTSTSQPWIEFHIRLLKAVGIQNKLKGKIQTRVITKTKRFWLSVSLRIEKTFSSVVLKKS